MKNISKTTICLYIILVIAIICSVISIIQSFTKNIPVDWSAMTLVYCFLAISFSTIEEKKKNQN